MLILLVANKFQKIVLISLFSVIPTILIWALFFFRVPNFWKIPLTQNGMATIVSNYDGPLYLVVAKTLYNKTLIESNYQFPLPTEYYAAHFPLFPILIRSLGFVINYPYAMLAITLLSSILALYFFNKLISTHLDSKKALFLTFIFSILPARFLIVRSVGSPDPLFIAAIIASLFYFKNKNFWAAGIWGMIAQFTKSPGILLFVAYLLYLLIFESKSRFKILKRAYPILLIPLALISVFGLYSYFTGDFWAYFHSGDNIHLMFPPFQIFNYSAPWVGTFWLEEVIFVYLFGILGILKLWEKKEYELVTFATVFFVSILFVSHRDLIRYSLPLVPLILLGYSNSLVKREFKIAVLVIIIPIFLFSLSFISQNVMPISNWAPFL